VHQKYEVSDNEQFSFDGQTLMKLRATPNPQEWMEQLTKEDANSNSDSDPILTTWKEQLIKKDANGNTGSMPSRKTLDGSAQRRKAY
jgi:hypothetical protein